MESCRSLNQSYSYPASYSESDARLKKLSRSQSLVSSLWNLFPTFSSLKGKESQGAGYDEADGSAEYSAAWMQAYCNAGLLVLVFIAGCICWAVYCVLEPFLQPLLWAVLIGTILHPFKLTWTERITLWLKALEKTGIPLSAGLVFSPLFIFNYVTDLLERVVLNHWKVLLGSVVGVASVWLAYMLRIPIHLYWGSVAVHRALLSLDLDHLTSYTPLVDTLQ